MSIIAKMTELAERIRANTTRPVTTDPRNVANTPCVLIEPPVLDPSVATACGFIYRFSVLVIGLPGARAELTPLDALLDQVLAVVDWTLAEPVGYVPLAAPGQAEPNQAYRVTVEVL